LSQCPVLAVLLPGSHLKGRFEGGIAGKKKKKKKGKKPPGRIEH